MKIFGVVGTALLFMLLGTGVSVYAQDQRDDAKPQAQEEEKKQEDKSVRQEEKKDEKAQEGDKTVRHDEKVEQNEHHEAVNEHRTEARRIPDDKFRAHFGHEHTFHIGHPVIVEGRPRFSYGGYSFVMVDPWPVGWGYNDQVYVDFIDGEYFLINPVHPGVRVVVNVAL
jgi:hypothetical protein